MSRLVNRKLENFSFKNPITKRNEYLINVNKYKTYSSIVQNFSITHFYNIENNEKQIQLEILSNGPVISAFLVYDDFYAFNPKESIYIHEIKIQIDIS